MTEGTSQGLFIVVAIVIFGLFVSLSYTLFGDTLNPALVSLFNTAMDKENGEDDGGYVPPKYTNPNYNVNGDITPTDEKLFTFKPETQTITNYTGIITDIVIPYEIDGIVVKHIGEYAFNRFEKNFNSDNIIKVDLTSVVIPNSVVTIGYSSFESNTGKSKLTSVNLGKNIEVIGPNAFKGSNIESIELPNKLKKLGARAFYDNQLKNINLPESLEVIEFSAFYNHKLTELVIPKSIEEIQDSAFVSGTDTLKKVTIKNNKENIAIHKTAFNTISPKIEFVGQIRSTNDKFFVFNKETQTIDNYTGKITDIIIPSEIGGIAVKHIGEYAFNRFEKNFNSDNIIKVDLTSVVIPNSVVTIGYSSFESNTGKSKLTSVSLGENIEIIGTNAFKGSNIESIELPNKLKKIGARAFYDTQLKNINLPESLEVIEFSAFYNHKLTELVIPKSVKEIQDSAFVSGTDTLKKVTIKNNKENIVIHKTAFNSTIEPIIYLP